MTKYWRNPPQPLAPDLANIEGARITDKREEKIPITQIEGEATDGLLPDPNPQPKRTRRRKSRKAV